MKGLGEAKDYTFLFDVCYYMEAGEGKLAKERMRGNECSSSDHKL